jgi:hypothetical protein
MSSSKDGSRAMEFDLGPAGLVGVRIVGVLLLRVSLSPSPVSWWSMLLYA